MTTNTQLVPVFSGELQNETVQLCNGRDLHVTLSVGRDFSNWMKGRIEEYGFIENEDYVRFSPNLAKTFADENAEFDSPVLANQTRRGGDRRSIEYHLTLDMAKQLAMVENNEKGRQVRRYFIEVEKRARESSSRGLPGIRQQLAAHNLRLKMLDKLESESHPEKRRAIHQQLDLASKILGLPTPALEAIGHDAPPEPPLISEFWEAVDYLTAAGVPINHARDSRYIAINLLEFSRLAQEHGLRLPPTMEFRHVLRDSREPRFIDLRTVNSAIVNRSVKCWIFVQHPADTTREPAHEQEAL